jgi:hypothetical protein
MTKKRIAVAAVVAGGLLAGPGIALASAPSHPARTGAGTIVNVCLTITPKSLGVTINGVPLGGGTSGLPTTCIGV